MPCFSLPARQDYPFTGTSCVPWACEAEAAPPTPCNVFTSCWNKGYAAVEALNRFRRGLGHPVTSEGMQGHVPGSS